MSLDRAALAAAVAARGTVARIVVADHAGSAPREAGAAMLVWPGGQSGTIGGGALEHDATARALHLLTAAAPFARHLLRQPLGPALGQCCGGTVTLLIERIGAEELAAIPESGLWTRPVATGAAGDPPLAHRRAQRDRRGGAPVAPLLAEGWFTEPLAEPRTAVWIYGAGHVGRALVATLNGLPFDLTWIDDAPARFPSDPLQGVAVLPAARPQDAVRLAPDDARHFVLTYSHAMDLQICHAVLSRRFGFLGLIGSQTKKARFLKRLRALGHPPERLARLTCPIGDPTLGKAPQAIAVGVAHALLTTRAASESGQGNGVSTA